MGGALAAPVELIRTERCGGPAVRCAVAEVQGWRLTHEDAHALRCAGSGAACWVLDGHGGAGAANFCAAELAREFPPEAALPSDERIRAGFAAVDERYRASLEDGVGGKSSGATSAGVLVAQQTDGSYSLKLVHCGDVRGFVLYPPGEGESSPSSPAVTAEGAVEDCQWPVIAATSVHQPNSPEELTRIEAAGGKVSDEDNLPRLDSSLAVSRAFGDFEFKSDKALPPERQKLSYVPDIFEVSGLPRGSLCLLGSGALFQTLPSAATARLVRERLAQDPSADLADLAAGLLRAGLRMKCQSNMTLAIISLSEGSDWTSMPVEMQNFEKLGQAAFEALPEDTGKQYLAFLQRDGFPAQAYPCGGCGRWMLGMNQCVCKSVFYCSKRCQKSAWKEHKPVCLAVSAKHS